MPGSAFTLETGRRQRKRGKLGSCTRGSAGLPARARSRRSRKRLAGQSQALDALCSAPGTRLLPQALGTAPVLLLQVTHRHRATCCVSTLFSTGQHNTVTCSLQYMVSYLEVLQRLTFKAHTHKNPKPWYRPCINTKCMVLFRNTGQQFWPMLFPIRSFKGLQKGHWLATSRNKLETVLIIYWFAFTFLLASLHFAWHSRKL